MHTTHNYNTYSHIIPLFNISISNTVNSYYICTYCTTTTYYFITKRPNTYIINSQIKTHIDKPSHTITTIILYIYTSKI